MSANPPRQLPMIRAVHTLIRAAERGDIGTDAMNALLDFGFGQLRLERLWLEAYDFNSRARRSYEKCGFILEGVERHAIHKHGRYHDVRLMSILSHDWAAQPRKQMWENGE